MYTILRSSFSTHYYVPRQTFVFFIKVLIRVSTGNLQESLEWAWFHNLRIRHSWVHIFQINYSFCTRYKNGFGFKLLINYIFFICIDRKTEPVELNNCYSLMVVLDKTFFMLSRDNISITSFFHCYHLRNT